MAESIHSQTVPMKLYMARTYATLENYAKEGAWSRVLGDIYYSNTATVSLELGKKVGDLVNQLPFKSSGKD